MTQEEIEKAACEYDDSLIYSPIPEQYDVPKAFIAGAEWRINSVWHNMSEEPKCKCMLALYNHGCVITINWDGDMKWEKMNKLYRIEKWAYVKDLLPDEEK